MKIKILIGLFLFVSVFICVVGISSVAKADTNEDNIVRETKSYAQANGYTYWAVIKTSIYNPPKYKTIYSNSPIYAFYQADNWFNYGGLPGIAWKEGQTDYNQTNVGIAWNRTGITRINDYYGADEHQFISSSHIIYKYSNSSDTANFTTDVFFTPPSPPVTYTVPMQYLQMNMRYTMPYYVHVLRDAQRTYFVCSSDKLYYASNGLHRSAEAYYFYSYDGGVTWQDGGYIGSLTWLLGGVTKTMIKKNNHDIYGTVAPTTNTSNQMIIQNKTEVIEIPENVIDGLETGAYQYEYNNGIENVKGLTIQKDALYRNGPLVVGESKTKYIVKWTAPIATGYKLELTIESIYGINHRRYNKQTYNKAWFGVGQKDIKVSDLQFVIDIQALGTELKNKVWNDVNTQGYISIPPTALYMRYVSLNDQNKKAYYGNWTRLQFKSGSNGIVETVKDNVITNETVDSEGNIQYEDIKVDGNVTEYINSSGETISEDESFTGVVDTVGSALDASTSAIKNIGSFVGQVPSLVGSLFVFIPQEILAFVGLALALLMILKIAGR